MADSKPNDWIILLSNQISAVEMAYGETLTVSSEAEVSIEIGGASDCVTLEAESEVELDEYNSQIGDAIDTVETEWELPELFRQVVESFMTVNHGKADPAFLVELLSQEIANRQIRLEEAADAKLLGVGGTEGGEA